MLRPIFSMYPHTVSQQTVYCTYLRQVDGANKSSIGNTSNRPASISKMNTSFDHQEKSANDPIGPTAPIPGPILFSVAATDENPVKNFVFSTPA